MFEQEKVKLIEEALEYYEARIKLEKERAESWKAIALEAEKELQKNKIIISNLKSRYGCETCPGLPKLNNPNVARRAFEAVYADKLNKQPPENFYTAPKHQRPIRFEELIYGK